MFSSRSLLLPRRLDESRPHDRGVVHRLILSLAQLFAIFGVLLVVADLEHARLLARVEESAQRFLDRARGSQDGLVRLDDSLLRSRYEVVLNPENIDRSRGFAEIFPAQQGGVQLSDEILFM